MNPYAGLPPHQFWRHSFAMPDAVRVEFDAGRKFVLPKTARIATAGSCFAQHFARHLRERGGHLLIAEERHPLVPVESEHGYGVFSARYGNIYSVRHLRELVEQALGARAVIGEYWRRDDGRWIDMLRPRAVPMGFASPEHAAADRDFHLIAVKRMLERMEVFVFTLGLTESWENVENGYCYPMVPGSAGGTFVPELHRFRNQTFSEVVADLRRVVELIGGVNPDARILLTVSPVALVATYEPRSVMASTCASKSILRAAADEVCRQFERVDYFPSYEIITGSHGGGKYWQEDGREVRPEGVATVMEVFLRSRMPELAGDAALAHGGDSPAVTEMESEAACLADALDAECDELLLDPAPRR